jgi:hypothetical protein
VGSLTGGTALGLSATLKVAVSFIAFLPGCVREVLAFEFSRSRLVKNNAGQQDDKLSATTL